jgi:hypothetical protein
LGSTGEGGHEAADGYVATVDDRFGHFYGLIGDVCESARLAELPVRLHLRDGTVIEGHPRPTGPEEARELDDTGYGDGIDIDDERVALSDVLRMTVCRPADD